MSLTSTRRRRRRSAIALVLAVGGVAASAARADRSYIGPDPIFMNGFWNTASNWSPAGVPTASDNVFIQPSGNVGAQVTYNGTFSSDLAILIDDPATINGSVTLHHNAGFDLGARYVY